MTDRVRIAMVSDIHGNSTALDAVLADIDVAGGADEIWALGDLVALGPDPVGVVERLLALPAVRFVRGNTDRYTINGGFDRPLPTAEEAEARPELPGIIMSFPWCAGALAAHGLLDWLGELPLEERATLPDGSRLLGVHASPGRDDGAGIHAGRTDDEFAAMLVEGEADIVCAGHTHHPFHRRVPNGQVANLGSVSNHPPDLPPRSSYLVLESDGRGTTIEHRTVDYDRLAVVAQLEKVRHPGVAYIAPSLRGTA